MKNHACNISEIYISSAFQKDNYTSEKTQAKSASRQQNRSDSWHVLYYDSPYCCSRYSFYYLYHIQARHPL